jgi:Protein of unknown function (DUF2934)
MGKEKRLSEKATPTRRGIGCTLDQLPDSIRKRAYELYGLRDRGDTRDRDDRLKAESQ